MIDTNGFSGPDRVFERENLSGARFRLVDLAGARFEQANLWKVVMRGVELVDVEITGQIQNVTVNGVDIAPLVVAELDRRDPERVAMRPTDAAGYRTAWEIVERRWGETVDRARALDPALLHERVDDEWSFIETLRHLLFATDAWVRRGLLGDPAPWHPLDLPWDTLEPLPETPCDREARPSLDEVLALRRDRMGTVRQVLADLDDDALAGTTTGGRRARVAPAGELPGRRGALDGPQRGVGAPALRRA